MFQNFVWRLVCYVTYKIRNSFRNCVQTELHTIEGFHCPYKCRSQWPCGLRRRSSAARLLRTCVRIPPVAWMFVCCECCVLPGRGLCEGLITHPEESYRLWRVVVCDQETSKTRSLQPAIGLWKIKPQWVVTPRKQTTNNCTCKIQLNSNKVFRVDPNINFNHNHL
jgi:hypothetical protein